MMQRLQGGGQLASGGRGVRAGGGGAPSTAAAARNRTSGVVVRVASPEAPTDAAVTATRQTYIHESINFSAAELAARLPSMQAALRRAGGAAGLAGGAAAAAAAAGGAAAAAAAAAGASVAAAVSGSGGGRSGGMLVAPAPPATRVGPPAAAAGAPYAGWPGGGSVAAFAAPPDQVATVQELTFQPPSAAAVDTATTSSSSSSGNGATRLVEAPVQQQQPDAQQQPQEQPPQEEEPPQKDPADDVDDAAIAAVVEAAIAAAAAAVQQQQAQAEQQVEQPPEPEPVAEVAPAAEPEPAAPLVNPYSPSAFISSYEPPPPDPAALDADLSGLSPTEKLAALQQVQKTASSVLTKAAASASPYYAGAPKTIDIRMYDQLVTAHNKLSGRLSDTNAHIAVLEERINVANTDLIAAYELLKQIAMEFGTTSRLAAGTAAAVQFGVDPQDALDKIDKLQERLSTLEQAVLEQREEFGKRVVRKVPVEWIGVASEVRIMGDFDDWTRGHDLSAEDVTTDSVYSRFEGVLLLRPGTYRVKFLVDDEWRLAADWPTERDPHGNEVCLLTVT